MESCRLRVQRTAGLAVRSADQSWTPLRPSDIMCSVDDPTKAAQMLDCVSTVKSPYIVASMVRAEGA
jgi:hypothetical protein